VLSPSSFGVTSFNTAAAAAAAAAAVLDGYHKPVAIFECLAAKENKRESTRGLDEAWL
jgi:hypothetical protein